MSKINMLLDEENELTFQVNIEGNRPADAACRLRLDNDEVGLMFEAKRNEEGEISVVIPPLKHVLKEGTYDMTLEVIVDDKYFEPLTLQGDFEKSVKVTAEAVVRTKKPKTTVSASTLVENKKKSKTPTATVSKAPEAVVKKESPVKPVRENKQARTKQQKSRKPLSDKDINKLIELLTKKQK